MYHQAWVRLRGGGVAAAPPDLGLGATPPYTGSCCAPPPSQQHQTFRVPASREGDLASFFHCALETRWLGVRKPCGIPAGLFHRNYRPLLEETGWLGADFISVCLETRWLSQKPWILFPGTTLYRLSLSTSPHCVCFELTLLLARSRSESSSFTTLALNKLPSSTTTLLLCWHQMSTPRGPAPPGASPPRQPGVRWSRTTLLYSRSIVARRDGGESPLGT